jgi:anti-sigma regulatory factor (Ser/Thr protein kinase)
MNPCHHCSRWHSRYIQARRDFLACQRRMLQACEEARESDHQSHADALRRAEMRGIQRTAFAFLQGRFSLLEAPPIPHYPHKHTESFVFERAEDISDSRHELAFLAQEKGMHTSQVEGLLLGYGEVATNAFRHGRQGCAQFYWGEEEVAFLVEDRGQGIPLELLPERVFRSYRSGAKSLGVGLTFLHNVIDGEKRLYTEEGRGTIWLCDQPLNQEIVAARDMRRILNSI